MTQTLPDPSPLNDALQRAHRSALASVAVCALAIGGMMMMSDASGADDEIDRGYAFAAFGMAAVSMLARRTVGARARNLRAFVYATLASLLGAVGLGVLGIVVALRDDQFSTGLLYALAGALLLLRPPPRLAQTPAPGSEH